MADSAGIAPEGKNRHTVTNSVSHASIPEVGRWRVLALGGLLAMACLCLSLLAGGSDAQGQTSRSRSAIEFDHASTGFQLTGGHAQVACERCHVQGVFRGTPTQCMQCHSPGGRVVSSFKPANHLPTTLNCNSCHRTTTWKPAFFTHNGIAPGSCDRCHNNSVAKGKPPAHLPTTMSCDSCHRTVAWGSASFKHIGVAPGTCATCHNGATARGKPSGHMTTAASCDSCHRTGGNWLLVSSGYNHAGVAPGTCITCHNGSRATGKPSTHVPTSASCDTCHRTTAWRPATFSHTGVPPGTCATCHNGTTATGKSAAHFVTTQSCDVCHRAGTGWTPVTTYTHRTAFYKTHRASVTCNACHTNNNEVIAWKYAGYKPDCAGCHAGDFKQGPHKKVDSPVIYYNVLELKDCSGSCHQYTNSTFTTISKNRTGQHRPTGSF